jgi:hypothetical protein
VPQCRNVCCHQGSPRQLETSLGDHRGCLRGTVGSAEVHKQMVCDGSRLLLRTFSSANRYAVFTRIYLCRGIRGFSQNQNPSFKGEPYILIYVQAQRRPIQQVDAGTRSSDLACASREASHWTIKASGCIADYGRG